jgi:hypothetical protein
MAHRQWLRSLKLTIKGKSSSVAITDLAIEFDVTKGIGSKPNPATIKVTNLSKDTRNRLGRELDELELEAGYEGGAIDIIYKGYVRDVVSTHGQRWSTGKNEKKEGGGKSAGTKPEADIVTTITCGDGDKAYKEGICSKTFPASTKPKEIVDYLSGEMPGTTKGKIKGLDDLPAYKRPVTVFGSTADELDKLGREHKFYWSIQDGQFEAVKNDQSHNETIKLNKDSGMIGFPSVTDKGIELVALLNPKIKPGRIIDVESGFIDQGNQQQRGSTDDGGGLFRVSECQFTGGNRKNDYYVKIKALRVQGKKVVDEK